MTFFFFRSFPTFFFFISFSYDCIKEKKKHLSSISPLPPPPPLDHYIHLMNFFLLALIQFSQQLSSVQTIADGPASLPFCLAQYFKYDFDGG